MPDPNPDQTIFISYRRSVSSYIARAIFMDLHAHGYDVFMDVASIDAGTFDTIILNQIAARGHFLIICTPGTFENCDQPGDWLRREIETAIEQGRNIVPIMANGFKFEDNQKFMTGGLADLPRLNAVPLFHEYFDEGMARLRDRYLKQPVAGALLPAPHADQPAVQQKIDQAVEQPAPTRDELTAEEYFNRAFARSDDDLDGKIADNSEAIRLNPDLAEAYNNRGWAREKQGDHAAAIADYDVAIRLNPNLAMAYNNRGIAHDEQGDLAAAIADYTRSIELKNPKLYLPYYNRGLAHRKGGDFEAAIADFDQAIRLNPSMAEAYSSQGVARAMQGDLDAAIADLDQAIHLNPNSAEAYNNRGEAHRRAGDFEAAITDFGQAIRLNPSLAEAYSNRGTVRANQGDLEAAIADCEQAIHLNPKFANAYYNRARVYDQRNKTAEAVSDFIQYLKLTSTEDNRSAHARERIKALGGVPPR